MKYVVETLIETLEEEEPVPLTEEYIGYLYEKCYCLSIRLSGMQSVRRLLPNGFDYGNKGQGIEGADKLEVVKQRGQPLMNS